MRLALLFVPLALSACGGTSSGAAAQLQLTSAGASPNAITVPNGGQVRFINQDTVNHQIASPDCAELSSPQLSPKGDFLATLTGGPKTCTFKDGLNPTVTSFDGTVTVRAPGTGGGGGGGY